MYLFVQIMSVEYMQVWKRLKSVYICVLAFLFILVGCRYSGGEILDFNKLLAGFENAPRQRIEVKPVVPFPALVFHPVIKVESVDIDDYFFHVAPES